MVKWGDIGRWRRSFFSQKPSLEILCSAGEIDLIVAMDDNWGTLNMKWHKWGLALYNDTWAIFLHITIWTCWCLASEGQIAKQDCKRKWRIQLIGMQMDWGRYCTRFLYLDRAMLEVGKLLVFNHTLVSFVKSEMELSKIYRVPPLGWNLNRRRLFTPASLSSLRATVTLTLLWNQKSWAS